MDRIVFVPADTSKDCIVFEILQTFDNNGAMKTMNKILNIQNGS
jgi:hypothetical protein